MRWIPIWLVVGCTTGGGLQGDQGLGLQDKEDDDNLTPPVDLGEVCPVEGFDAVCAGPAAGTSELTATGGDGRIDLVHTGLDDLSCGQWTADATYLGTGEIEIVYEFTSPDTACPDTCAWTLTYWLEDVPAGAWHVTAGDDEVTVTVR